MSNVLRILFTSMGRVLDVYPQDKPRTRKMIVEAQNIIERSQSRDIGRHFDNVGVHMKIAMSAVKNGK